MILNPMVYYKFRCKYCNAQRITNKAKIKKVHVSKTRFTNMLIVNCPRCKSLINSFSFREVAKPKPKPKRRTKEQIKEYNKAYKIRNKEKLLKYQKKYSNKETSKEKRSIYYFKNRIKILKQMKKRKLSKEK